MDGRIARKTSDDYVLCRSGAILRVDSQIALEVRT
jgi:hypothetical protein